MLDTPRYRRTAKHQDERFYRHTGPLQQKVEEDILHHGKPLNIRQEADLQNLFVEVPELVAGNNATQGWGFCHPPALRWKNSKRGTKLDEADTYMFETYYMPFRWEAYIRGRKQFGLVCWKYKKIGDWNVPVIPPVGSGVIYHWFSPEDMTWHYRWMWKNQPDMGFDLDMCFYIWYPPTVDGNFTSPAMSILNDWKMAKHISLTTQRITHQASRLPVFMVHRPPKGKPGDSKFDFPFGDAEDVEYERDQHNRHLEKGVMSRNANREAVEHSRALNEGRAMAGQLLTTGEVYGHKPLLNSESLIDIEKREGEGVLDRLHYLDDHWEPVNATAPPMLVDPLAHTTRLGQVSATIVDFPISMAMDKHGQHKGNFDAQIAFARDRMKESGAAMCRMLKAVFLDAQAHMLKKMYTKAVSEEVERRSAKASNSQPMSEEEMMQINLEFKDIEIEQKCTPLVSAEQVTEMWEMAVLSSKGYVQQMAHIMGIPDEYLETEMKKPLMRKREMEMKQVELAEKQFTLSKDTAKQQQSLAEDQFQLTKEQARQEAAQADAGGASKKKKTDK